MALTELQKAQVRMFLGYQAGYDLSSELESRLDSLSASEETLVVGVLTRLLALETKEDSALDSGAGELKRVEDVWFRDGDPFQVFADQGRRLAARLAALLGVTPRVDYFASGETTGCPIPLG